MPPAERRGSRAPHRWWALALAAALLAGAAPGAHGLEMSVVYTDAPGTGFDEPQRGPARRAALEFAVAQWGATLAGDVPVVVEASMRSLGGTATSAVLAQTGPVSVHRDFGAGVADTWYGAALANQLAGIDVNGAQFGEIEAVFNADVDDDTVLGSIGWYYGTDAAPGADIDFVTIALHELGHGLNFFDLLNPDTGEPLLEGSFGIFERQVERTGVGSLVAMRSPERIAAVLSGQLVWGGANVLAALREPALLYAPSVFAPGSSVSHWDVSLTPDEVIEPFYTGPNHELGLLLPALVDMGWRLAVPTATPRTTRSVVPSPTRTRTPTRTPTPRGTPTAARFTAYVTNFDDGTVSVLDGRSRRVVDTLRVGAGPLGVTVGADGRFVYVANFHAGSLSVIDRRARRVVRTIPVSDAAHSVAVSPDQRTAYVSDTFDGTLTFVDLAAGAAVGSIAIGRQPAGVALAPDGRRLYVANYGDNAIAVVDTELRTIVAISSQLRALPQPPARPLGLALAPGGRFGYIATQDAGALAVDDTRDLAGGVVTGATLGTIEAVVVAADELTSFATAHDDFGGDLLVIERRRESVQFYESTVVDRVPVGAVPQALALQPDGAAVYVANTADGTVSIVDTATRKVVATVPVGRAPMGVAIAADPVPPCPGDCTGDGEVAIPDLIAAVAVALGDAPLDRCASADNDGDGRVSIAELILATRSSLAGCP